MQEKYDKLDDFDKRASHKKVVSADQERHEMQGSIGVAKLVP